MPDDVEFDLRSQTSEMLCYHCQDKAAAGCCCYYSTMVFVLAFAVILRLVEAATGFYNLNSTLALSPVA